MQQQMTRAGIVFKICHEAATSDPSQLHGAGIQKARHGRGGGGV